MLAIELATGSQPEPGNPYQRGSTSTGTIDNGGIEVATGSQAVPENPYQRGSASTGTIDNGGRASGSPLPGRAW